MSFTQDDPQKNKQEESQVSESQEKETKQESALTVYMDTIRS